MSGTCRLGLVMTHCTNWLQAIYIKTDSFSGLMDTPTLTADKLEKRHTWNFIFHLNIYIFSFRYSKVCNLITFKFEERYFSSTLTLGNSGQCTDFLPKQLYIIFKLSCNICSVKTDHFTAIQSNTKVLLYYKICYIEDLYIKDSGLQYWGSVIQKFCNTKDPNLQHWSSVNKSILKPSFHNTRVLQYQGSAIQRFCSSLRTSPSCICRCPIPQQQQPQVLT